MAYNAIVCKLGSIQPHPNADKLRLCSVNGYQIILGLEEKEGDLGIFFPTDGEIIEEHLSKCNLFRHPEKNADKTKAGYFEDTCRVKSTKLRGEWSDGFWQEISKFEWLGDLSKLKPGDLIDSINGKVLCQKYYTKATRAFMAGQINKKKDHPRRRLDLSMFKEHYDTKQLRDYWGQIRKGSILYISEKCHGTSGRTGYVLVDRELPSFKKWVNKWCLLKFPEDKKWQYVSGTRRTVMLPGEDRDGYYKDTKFRSVIHDQIELLGLAKGETIYYEIVGFTDGGSPIMPQHGISDKETKKRYGDKMTYSYGCNAPNCRVLVYRITVTNEDGVSIDYSWSQIVARCNLLGLETVPHLKTMVYVNQVDLTRVLNELSDGPSTLDPKHTREGVVVRVDHEDFSSALKWKGHTFCDLEGICKNNDSYVDPEEVS